MTEEIGNILNVDAEQLQSAELVEVVQRAQRIIKRAQTCDSCSSAGYSSVVDPLWIRAELDNPYDQERSRDFKVIAYNETFRQLKVCEGNDSALADSTFVVYSRLPSRIKSKIYFFRENAALLKGRPARRYRVSTKEQAPLGFVKYCEIRLQNLSLKSRVMIWIGSVEWLYILPESRPREYSFGSEKSNPSHV